MSFTSEDIGRIQSNEIKHGESFQFECQMCGHCCKGRSEPIVVTGYDVFRFSRALGMSLKESIDLNCTVYLGHTSHIPVCVLQERMDGSCRLMRKGKCMVQNNKPAVCALYPLGRYYDIRDKQFHYFTVPENQCAGTKADHEWMLDDWINHFHLEENIEESTAWNRLMIGITNVTAKWDTRRVKKNQELFGLMLAVLYMNYRYDLPYIAQVEANMEIARVYFNDKFNKTLEF